MAGKSPRKSAAEISMGTRLSDNAYTKVLEALFEGRIPAGSFVSQSELVGLTGAPLAPLRDALRILEAEGIVLIHPRTGIQFVKPGFELTRATFQFRSIIESGAAAVFAETASDADIEAIRAQHQQILSAIEENGLRPEHLEQLETLEDLLHGSIVASLSNPLIDTSYRRVRNYLRLIRLDRKLTSPLVLRSLREHLTIIDACKARSPAKAVAALQSHFAAALQRTLGLY
jgi:DNA-binding GntR family transcriptional regulator